MASPLPSMPISFFPHHREPILPRHFEGSQNSEFRSQNSEFRSQKSAIGSQESEEKRMTFAKDGISPGGPIVPERDPCLEQCVACGQAISRCGVKGVRSRAARLRSIHFLPFHHRCPKKQKGRPFGRPFRFHAIRAKLLLHFFKIRIHHIVSCAMCLSLRTTGSG